MGITVKPVRQQLIFLSILLMIVALFTSRALLSVGTILFLLFTCVHSGFRQQIMLFLRNPFLVFLTLLFIIPFLSWFWSQDKEMWGRFARVKLPLLLLPLAFAGNWRLSAKQWKQAGLAFILLAVAGSCWSLWQYFQNTGAIHEGYLRAKVIPTPLGNDHVRYSLLVCIALMTSILLFKQLPQKKWKITLGVTSIFFIIYLHVLSARTGLIAFYIFLVLAAVYLLFRERKNKWSLVLLAIMILLPFAAWYLLPTFQNRIRYIIYDFSYIKTATYLPGANDGNRILSIKAGWDILKNNPWGVGSGDVVPETWAWYERNIPGMLETDKFFPSSEWLMYGGTAGWIGVILFTTVMLLPFFQKNISEPFFWFSLNTITVFSFLFDIGLEVQYGVFIYGFIILWWWKWLKQPGNADIKT
jgi:O-antigen ligase